MTTYIFTGKAAWSGSGDFSWDTAGNWGDGAVPTISAGDTVILAPYAIDRNTTNVLVTDSGTLSNPGTIILSPHGSTADYFMQFKLTGALELTGGGEFRLAGTTLSPVDIDLNGFLFENAGNEIDGSGFLDDRSNGGGGVFTNDAGAIVDGSDAHGELTLNVKTIHNAGLLEATGAGGLTIAGNVQQSTSGKILANGGDVTIVVGSTIVGGMLSAVTKFKIVLDGQLDGTGAVPVTIGKGTLVDAAALELVATSGQTARIVNSGVISVGTAAAAGIWINGSTGGVVKLSGGGTVEMFGSEVTGGLLDNFDNTIVGQTIFTNALTNEGKGVIDFTGVSALRNIPVINSWLIEATAGAGLSLEGATLDQSGGGTLLADGANIIFDTNGGGWGSSAIIGGTLTSEAGGVFEFLGQTGTLDGTNTKGLTLSKGTIFDIGDGQTLTLAAGGGQTAKIVNRGAINVASGAVQIGSDTGGKVQLTGGGVLALTGGTAQITGAKSGGLDILENVNNLIEGATVFDANGGLQVQNDKAGVIDANIAGETILFETGDTVVNDGVLKADAGTLEMDDAVTGGGSAVVAHSGKLEFNSTFNENIAFTGVGGVSFAKAYGGTISGLGVGDTITLNGITADMAFVNGDDQLVLTNSGTVVDKIQLAGDNSGFSFLAVESGGKTVVSVVLALDPTVAQYLAHKAYYDSVTGGVHIVDSVANIVAALTKLNADPKIASLTATSGTATLQGGAAHINAPAFSLTGAGTSLKIAGNLVYAGAFSEGNGTNVSLIFGNLILSGTNTLSGATGGLGTLWLLGGTTTITSGATISTEIWNIAGKGATTVQLGGALAYDGVLTGVQAQIALNGGDLTLSDFANLVGVTVTGAHTIRFDGIGDIGALSLAGSSALSNTNVMIESGGSVVVGDNVATDLSSISNAVGAVWAITDNSSITRGADLADNFTNAGLFEKTGGTGVSIVSTAMMNTGFIAVDSGTLDLKGAVSGTGAASILGAATLEFDSAVASTQNVNFSGSGGELFLGAPGSFHGQIAGYDMIGGGASDTLALGGAWTPGHFVENSAGTSGVLNLTSGSKHVGLTLAGAYLDGHFLANAGPGNSTLITYA